MQTRCCVVRTAAEAFRPQRSAFGAEAALLSRTGAQSDGEPGRSGASVTNRRRSGGSHCTDAFRPVTFLIEPLEDSSDESRA